MGRKAGNVLSRESGDEPIGKTHQVLDAMDPPAMASFSGARVCAKVRERQ